MAKKAKPKFKVGDKVRQVGTEEAWSVIGIVEQGRYFYSVESHSGDRVNRIHETSLVPAG